MTKRQQALLLQVVGLLLAILVAPGLVRGWAKPESTDTVHGLPSGQG